MPNISDRLDAVIEKLDGMTSETVEKNLDTTIASKVDHISKQLDYISGGGSGGSSGTGIVVPVYTVTLTDAEHSTYTAVCDMTYEEIIAAVREKKCSHCYVKDTSVPFNAYTSLKLSYITDDDGNYLNNSSISFTDAQLTITNSQIGMRYIELLHISGQPEQIVYTYKEKSISI